MTVLLSPSALLCYRTASVTTVRCKPCKSILVSGSVLPQRSVSRSNARTSRSEKQLQEFWTWLVREGVVSEGSAAIRPALVQEGVGLVAQRNLRKGEELVQVPRKLWLTVQTVKESEVGPFCQDLRPWLAIALYLIKERANPASRWRPYLDILPRDLDSPLFWSDEELVELQGTQLLSSTLNYKDYVEAEFRKVQEDVILKNPKVFKPEDFQLEAFMWAYGILSSRTFPPLTGENFALVPLADLINHQTGAGESWTMKSGGFFKTSGFFGSQDALVVRTPSVVNAGQQVTMEYGATKGQGVLALDYGFIEYTSGSSTLFSGNERESFTLTLEIPEADRFYDDKVDIAEINGFKSSFSVDIIYGQGLPENMLTFLRLMTLCGPDAFLLEALFRNSAWSHMSSPVSRENEEAVCTAMLDGCSSALASYTTTIDEDLRLLRIGVESPRLEIAVVVRLGEKRVLEELQTLFEARMAELDKLEYYAERRLRDLGLLDDKGYMTPWVFND